MRSSDVLGINARSSNYLKKNWKSARRIADSKFLTKKFLRKYKLPNPKMLGLLSNLQEVEDFDWMSLDGAFVIKPVDGLGGSGILIVKKPAKYAGEWLLMDGKKVTIQDFKLQARDIIEGRYSRNNLADRVLIEQRVKIHPKFRKIAVGGTPDVRVVVFNRVPVMAMLRVPTEESKGKSNLHQGALGLGLDIATGITTYGVHHNKRVKYFPGTKRKVNGITVPNWLEVLDVASRVQFRLPRLGYFGVDILIDKEVGPQIIELNDQPGLSIQIANMAGLRRRLERVEGLEIETPEKGIKVARSLFASKFSHRVGLPGDKQVIGIFEKVKIKPHKGKRIEVRAKVDTGAYMSSIDEGLAEELGLLKKEHVLWERTFKSALGKERREVIMVNVRIRGVNYRLQTSVTSREGLRTKMILGRRDLKQFLVDPKLVKVR